MDFESANFVPQYGLNVGLTGRLFRQLTQLLARNEADRFQLGKHEPQVFIQLTLMNNLGVVYRQLGYYQKAINIYNEILTVYQEIDDPVPTVQEYLIVTLRHDIHDRARRR